MDNKLTEDDINNIIEEVDEDGSGTLDFDGDDYDDYDEVDEEEDYLDDEDGDYVHTVDDDDDG